MRRVARHHQRFGTCGNQPLCHAHKNRTGVFARAFENGLDARRHLRVVVDQQRNVIRVIVGLNRIDDLLHEIDRGFWPHSTQNTDFPHQAAPFCRAFPTTWTMMSATWAQSSRLNVRGMRISNRPARMASVLGNVCGVT